MKSAALLWKRANWRIANWVVENYSFVKFSPQWLSLLHPPMIICYTQPTRSHIGNLCSASNQSAICQEVKPAMESHVKFDNNLIMNFWWHPGSTTYGSTPVYTTYSTTSTSATSMDSPSESYKKQNGLDYPVNVARWGKHFHLLMHLCSHPNPSFLPGT